MKKIIKQLVVVLIAFVFSNATFSQAIVYDKGKNRQVESIVYKKWSKNYFRPKLYYQLVHNKYRKGKDRRYIKQTLPTIVASNLTKESTEEAAKKAETPHPSRPASPESAPTETKEKAKEIFGAAKKLSANVAATVKGAEKKGPPEMPMIPKRASGDAKKRTVTFGWNKGGNNEVDEVYMKFNCGYVTCTKKTVNIDAKLGKFTVDGIDADAYVDIILNGI